MNWLDVVVEIFTASIRSLSSLFSPKETPMCFHWFMLLVPNQGLVVGWKVRALANSSKYIRILVLMHVACICDTLVEAHTDALVAG